MFLIKTLAEDTQPAAEAVLIELLRNASPARKIGLVMIPNRTVRALALTGLRERYPAESAAQLRRRLADLWLGRELAAKAYGPIHESRSDYLLHWARELGLAPLLTRALDDAGLAQK